ncbi:aldose 1-epimerase family protein [Flavobacterium crassostreae]|uniref:Aldose epimerase n=1 Tax=Flavobacterium crassostreae TaxID=1763534 RepID=A0A1B9DYS9_9FLAO|nr:aldose 1-epimerase family protein [Flavobacterium crassostreae]OCB74839.1 aldose epimerase [Flavobacterium crassostreae]
MKTTISNAFLSAEIKHAGAEVFSLKNVHTNQEYLWDANPEFWGKHAPVLFPIVGTLKNNQYRYKQQNYSLSRHGFARDMVFELIEKKDDRATFVLKNSADTLQVYPFEFELQICYTLVQNSLVVGYKVQNLNSTEMPFCIGAHPAFALAGQFEDYALEFKNKVPLRYTLLENNLISNQKATLSTTDTTLSLEYALFKNNALIFRSIPSKTVTILAQKKPLLQIEFEDFPDLGLWTLPNAPFICIEPWFGYSDTVTSSGNIMEKEGIEILQPKATFRSQYTITVF